MPKHLHENHLGAGLSFDGNVLVGADSGPQAFSAFLPGDVLGGYTPDLMLSMPQGGTILTTAVRSGSGSGSALLLVNGITPGNVFQPINSDGTTLNQTVPVAVGDRISVRFFVAIGSLADVFYQVTWSPGG